MVSSQFLDLRWGRNRNLKGRRRAKNDRPPALEVLESRVVLSEFLQVNSIPINVTTGPTAPSFIPVISFDAPGADPNGLRLSINYGNGAEIGTNHLIQNVGPSYYLISAENAYQTAGNFTATVTVTDATSGDSVTINDPVTVTAPPPLGTTGNILTTAGTPFQNFSTSSNLTFLQQSVISFTGNGTAAADFSATIDWGDGSGSTGGTITGPFSLNGQATYFVDGTHIYEKPGNYTGHVTVQGPIVVPSAYGMMYTYSFQATASYLVPPYQPTISLVETTAGDPIPSLLPLVSFFTATSNAPSPNSNLYSAVIDWGDGTPASEGLITSGGTDITVESSGHTYASPGYYDIKVKLSDPGDPNLFTTNLVAYVTKPTVTPIPVQGVAGTLLATPGTTVPLETLTAQNPTTNAGQTILEKVPLAAGYYSAMIDWGDGSPESTATITENLDTTTLVPSVSSLTVSGPGHTYTTPGTYPVTIHLGTTGQPNLSVDTTLVTVAPSAVPITGALDPASDRGVSNTDGITNDITPTFTGTAAPGSTVRM